MKTYRYNIASVPAAERTFFQEMIPYVSEYVTGAACDDEDLVVEYEAISEEALVEKIKRLETMIASQLEGAAGKPLQTKVLTDCSNVAPRNTSDVFQGLVECGAVSPTAALGPGPGTS